MEVFCLGNKAWQACYVVRLANTTIMLDCVLDLSVLLNFLPLPLVFSPKLSSLHPVTQQRGTRTPLQVFKENVGHIFVDSTPLVKLPEAGLVNIATVDVLLLSNCFSLLALPYLTEVFGFKGKVYATEPTRILGRQIIEELCEYVHRTPAPDRSAEWRQEDLIRQLPDCILKQCTDLPTWRSVYSLAEAQEALSLVQGVSYGQKIDLFGQLIVTPVSSGYCLGSCNWLLETEFSKVAYVSSSSTFTTHPCPMERPRLLGCDVMLLSGLTDAPSANPDSMLGELCTRMAATLKNGGNVLIPCYPTGVVYDLLECLYMYLDNAGLSHVPVYFISPVAKSSLSYSNIFAEWLCDSKQSKVYIPDPPFPHAEFLKSGRLKHFPNIHGDLGSVYQSPCVLFTGHPSLRCGDAVHFMEVWGSSNKNSVIFTDPDFDYMHALAPYQPLNMKAFYFPIDPCLNFTVANKLLKELTPRHLVTHCSYLPAAAQTQKESSCLQPEMPYHGMTRGSVVTVDLASKFQRIQLAPELAGTLLPQEVSPGVLATSLSGMLTVKSGGHVLHPQTHPSVKRLWGQPQTELIVKALHEQGIHDASLDKHEDKEIINLLGGKTQLVISSGNTTITNCHDDKLRVLLKDTVLRQLTQL